MENYSVIKRAGLYLAAGVVGLTSLVGCGDSKGLFEDMDLPVGAAAAGAHSVSDAFGEKLFENSRKAHENESGKGGLTFKQKCGCN
jgi:hypothetical protein